MRTEKFTLLLPVENQVRELDGKLLLGCAAAERGFRVILGSLTFVEFLAPHLPRGIYFAKSMTPVGQKMLRLVKALGHDIVAWDEESLVRFNAPDYPNWRYSPIGFGLLDHLFAWGRDDAEIFAGYHGYRGAPIHVTGNSRIDLLRPELREYFRPQVDDLKRRFGEFILINTNFAFVNHFSPAENLWQGPGHGEDGRGVARPGRGMSIEFARAQAAHVQIIFDAFKALLPRLSAWYPNYTIVIRPHPSENHETWRSFERQHTNVRILHEGSAIPWLMACKVLLHNGCTTAVEAAVLGTPTVSYQPVMADAHDYHLPNSLSHAAYTEAEVRSYLDTILGGELGAVDAQRRQQIFDRHLCATDGTFAVDRVVDVLSAQAIEHRLNRRRSPTAWVMANGRMALKLCNMLRPAHRNSFRYHRQRFPHISEAQIQERIARLSALLGRFQDVTAKTVAPYTFSLESEQVL